MEKAIYSLVAMLFGRMIVGWSKGFYFKYKMYRQLKSEISFIHKTITNNRQRIEKDNVDTSFPLLQRIEMPLHEKLISKYILDELIANEATALIGNCRHYNRIIEIGEKDKDKKKRKSEVLNQGALIFNEPPLVFEVQGDNQKPYTSQTISYIKSLDERITKYKKTFKFFPWYLLLIRFEDEDQPSASS